jgi:large subunit ribosomal protein L15
MRGFNNRFKVEYVPVNLDFMDSRFDANANVDPTALANVGLLGNANDPIVVLARGEISKPLHVKAHRVSGSAKEKIEAAGGSVEILPYEVNKNLPRS